MDRRVKPGPIWSFFCWTVLDHFEPFWTTMDGFGRYRAIFEYFWPYWIILSHFRPCWIISNSFGQLLTIMDHIWPFWIILDHVGSCWTILDPFGLYLTNLDNLGNVLAFWTILDHLRLYWTSIEETAKSNFRWHSVKFETSSFDSLPWSAHYINSWRSL